MMKLGLPLTVRSVLLLTASFCSVAVNADDWPQWRGPQRDGVWRESGLIEKFPASEIKAKWRTAIGAGYSGPTVSSDRVLVTDRLTEPTERERVICLDRETGKVVWTHAYDVRYAGIGYTAGPRASVTVHDGRAYALGAMGMLNCLDVESGKVVWAHDLNQKYRIEETKRMPIWGLASSPLVEGDLLIVQVGGAEGACMVAFDRKTGEEKWRALDDRASYAAPIIVPQAGRRVLVCWTGDSVSALDPASGKTLWRHAFAPVKMVLFVATPVYDDHRLFFTAFYDGSLMLKLNPDKFEATAVWQRRGPNELNTDALQSIISTPLMRGDYIYGVDSYGQLRCLDARTGERIWEDLTAVPKARWSTIHFTPNGDKVWMFNERGELLITRLSPKGLTILSRAKLIEPTQKQLPQRGGVCWAHPAYAFKHVFARNDKEIVCASLAE